MGSGTTAVVAKKLDRQFIGIDISPEYCKMAEERLVNPLSITRRGNKTQTKQQTLFNIAENQ